MEARAVGASLLLAWLAVAGDVFLDHAREVNLAYAANMPSFVADETAERYTSAPGSSKWKHLDTVQTEITFSGPRALRRQIRRNGKDWNKPFEELPNFRWYGGFGTEIRPVFGPRCPTTLDYAGTHEELGKTLREFLFRSPAGGCFAHFYYNDRESNPERTGHVWLDEASGRVIRLDEEATDFPADSPFAKRDEQVTWGDVKIGETIHLLPVAAHFDIWWSSGARTRIEVEYRNHRHFEASSNIQFAK